MEQIKLAEIVARVAHCGQVDKAGKPYIGHPTAVASMVNSEAEKTVALLHDVVEDTNVTLNCLRVLGFPEDIVVAVDAITRRPGELRQDYLNRVAANEIATKVKIADLIHNSDLSRISETRPLEQKDYERSWRYFQEIGFLSGN